MTYQQKINTATIWPNRKTKDSQPDYRGTINWNGEEIEIALWEKQSSGGKDFLGGTVKPKQAERASVPTGGRNDPRPPAHDDLNDDLRDFPF